MQCQARRAAQGGPLCQRRNAAMRPSRSNPAGSPRMCPLRRPPTLLHLLAVAPLRRVATPSIRPVSGAARPLIGFITCSRAIMLRADAASQALCAPGLMGEGMRRACLRSRGLQELHSVWSKLPAHFSPPRTRRLFAACSPRIRRGWRDFDAAAMHARAWHNPCTMQSCVARQAYAYRHARACRQRDGRRVRVRRRRQPQERNFASGQDAGCDCRQTVNCNASSCLSLLTH